MLCQHCQKNEATTQISTSINGKHSSYRLCSKCAQELGYSDILPDLAADFNGLLSSIFSNALPAISGAAHCRTCGSTLNDIKRSGKVGCADCYDTFFSELIPTIRSVHGNTEHRGKRPASVGDAAQTAAPDTGADQIVRLKEELKQAIKNENFERAAQLRDEIKGLEG